MRGEAVSGDFGDFGDFRAAGDFGNLGGFGDFEASEGYEEAGSKALTPTQFLEGLNQVLAYETEETLIEGEVASFKVSQGKWVFFDLKDTESSVPCFLPAWKLKIPLEDGMKIVAQARAKVTKWGKFSLTVERMQPVGEGSLKRAFLMLKRKLAKEGLFLAERKREVSRDLSTIGVISSTQAAGYADFMKILNARWGGIKVVVAHTQVQGLEAPEQIRRALEYFNERGEVEAIVLIRGGGSADDLAAFNDEALVRAVAASKIPVVTGIGHEVDEVLVDLAADLVASTPSNAAELLTRDRREVGNEVVIRVARLGRDLGERVSALRRANAEKVERAGQGVVARYIEPARMENRNKIEKIGQGLISRYIEPRRWENRSKVEKVGQVLVARYIEPRRRETEEKRSRIEQKICSILQLRIAEVEQKLKILEALNPEKVLKQGYAILGGKVCVGSVVKITTFREEIRAKVEEVVERVV